MILNGNTPTIDEVFSYFPETAPFGYVKDDDAADRLEMKMDAAKLPDSFDPVEGVPADLVDAARQVERLRARWEATLAKILDRHWQRQRKILLAKIRSVQFRKDTPLWEPPGPTPLADRLDMLIDLDAWDAELRAEMERALTDLYAEALDHIGQVSTKADSLPQFILNWITHALSFNRRARRAVERVLAAKPTRVEDVEQAVDDYVDQTMHFVGDQVATSLATGAVNEAQYDAAIDADLGERIWFSAQDGRVRPQHRHVNLQRAKAGKPFKVRDRKGRRHKMMFPGDITAPPDLWMNCRCVQLFVTPGSRQSWLRSDGSPIDPYGRATLLATEGKGVDPSLLGITWAE